MDVVTKKGGGAGSYTRAYIYIMYVFAGANGARDSIGKGPAAEDAEGFP